MSEPQPFFLIQMKISTLLNFEMLIGGAGSLEQAALSLHFPANREFNREILRF